MAFDNAYVLSKMEENRISKQQMIIQKLRPISPTLTDEELLQLYNTSISIHQSNIQGNGNFLENHILVDILNIYAILSIGYFYSIFL